MLTLQRQPAECFLPALPCKGLGRGNPLLEEEKFSASRGQLSLHRNQGGGKRASATLLSTSS